MILVADSGSTILGLAAGGVPRLALKGVGMVGKAAYNMAKECEIVLKDKILGGVVVSTSVGKLSYLKHFTSTHPLVSEKSIEAATLLIDGIPFMRAAKVP